MELIDYLSPNTVSGILFYSISFVGVIFLNIKVYKFKN